MRNDTTLRSHDEAVRLFERNKNLAHSFAFKYMRRVPASVRSTLAEEGDIITEAYLGLWIACQKFDPSRGFQFSTYASRWIQSKILRLLFPEHIPGSERLETCSLSGMIPGLGSITIGDTLTASTGDPVKAILHREDMAAAFKAWGKKARSIRQKNAGMRAEVAAVFGSA